MRFHLILTAALAVAGAASAQEHGGHAQTWTYGGTTGPERWSELDPANAACAVGQQESPIDLTGAIAADLGPLRIDWSAMPAAARDTGHAIQMDAPAASEGGGSTMTVGGKTYRMLQFHVHQPAEHLLNGRRFPLEIHFVHAGPDGILGVLGVFAETGEASAPLQAVLDSLGAETHPSLDPNGFLPAGRDFFRYEGSLTTPPCSETVDWVVLNDPITASQAQIDAFERIHPGNTRPIQPLHRRFLLRSGH
ncbi:carbonic anhydrase [Brevundimonas staleyi]|uniref:carbonic anhydrase n=1 Tax=Brevundimonas staleyi TaxID=74326 RepID=A0ABW0FTW4_9CAUL